MKRILLIICILSLIILISGCTNNNPNTISDTIPTDKYVAVYDEYTNISTLIGNTTYTPSDPWPIPMPTIPFDYNNSTGNVMMTMSNDQVVNDSFKILLGRMSYSSSPVAYGYEGTFVNGVYDFPYTVDDGFMIVKVVKNGTIYASYNDESIILSPGDNWTSPVTTGSYMGIYHTNEIPTPSNGTVIYLPWPVTYNMSFTITNMGVFNKSLLNSIYSN